MHVPFQTVSLEEGIDRLHDMRLRLQKKRARSLNHQGAMIKGVCTKCCQFILSSKSPIIQVDKGCQCDISIYHPLPYARRD